MSGVWAQLEVLSGLSFPVKGGMVECLPCRERGANSNPADCGTGYALHFNVYQIAMTVPEGALGKTAISHPAFDRLHGGR